MNRGSIFHICRGEEWAAAKRLGTYRGSSQDAADGFIHFSTAAQIVASAAKHQAGQDNLVLVEVDPAALGEVLRWQRGGNGQLFPHLYGALPLAAVRRVAALRLGADGRHRFPWGLER